MARPKLYDTSNKFYFTGKPCKRGHIAQRRSSTNECVECIKFKAELPENKEKRSQYHKNNAEAINKRHRDRYKKNIEKERERSRKKWILYPEKVKATNLNWVINNPDKMKALRKKHSVIRRLVVKQQMPKWANKEKIKEIYMNKPEGYHVDHIIPLRGKIVSGLHVENNLQYLTLHENSKKRNKFIGV